MTLTKVYNNNQTAIPSEIRKKLNIAPDDIVEWILWDDGRVEVVFRKRSVLKDIIGIGSTVKTTNGVELQKQIEKGESVDFDRF